VVARERERREREEARAEQEAESQWQARWTCHKGTAVDGGP
jgi:hypothetical protein